MIDIETPPPCGWFCTECSHFDKECTGCRQTEGKPFWISKSEMSVCTVYNCCTEQKTLEHCGLCSQMQCKTFLDLRDPSMSDEEFQKSLNERKANLLKRAETNSTS